jgi:hypothetical protein
MSVIIPLFALSAFLYAIVILLIALVYHTPRVIELIDLSVSFYRLLLAAYPAPFCNEYGEAMVQLFRDTARDAYWQRGLRGLAMAWLRTLSDFTISVIRQHRDKPAAVTSESVLLHDLLQKWRRLGAEALSVTAFSTWYGWHLLRLYFQRAVLVWATLTVLAFGLWFTSFFDSIRLVRWSTSAIGISRGGSVLIGHYHDEGEPISHEQWQRDCREWVKKNPSVSDRLLSTAGLWEFSFFSDIPEGRVIQYGPDLKPLLIQPGKSWRLRFPFGIVPVLLLGWTIRVYLRRNSGSVAAMQSA